MGGQGHVHMRPQSKQMSQPWGAVLYSMVVEYRTDLSAVDSLQDWQQVRVHSGLTPPHMACHVPDPQSGL